ncbi:hypothetical protein [Pelagibacterium sediminicola]|uniref:hypothetical protein n=1 Tax=Pelagibacterium sediminicola TaxID=2248761 RepID=UPI000E30EAAB|nr:hypothetical protein [Pelagibacterium sediminicola]
MTRRKIIGAALFVTLFGTAAIMPPLLFVAGGNMDLLGIPVAMVYVFTIWILMIVGAVVLARYLPHDEPTPPTRQDHPS